MHIVNKVLLFSMALMLALLPFSGVIAQENPEPLQITVNETILEPDVPPFIEEGRTLVEMRAVFSALGAELTWDAEAKTVTATKNELEIFLTIGETTAIVQDEPYEMDVPARIVDGRTVVPARFVSESLGANVDWDETTRTVTITTLEERPTVIPEKEIGELPAAIEDWVDYSSTLWLGQEKSYEGTLYILVTYGEQPTGGYEVDIQKVAEYEDKIVVTVRFIEPEEGEPVSLALTYPYDLYAIEDTDKPVTYEAVGAQEYVPTLMGIDELPPIMAESRGIKVFKPAPGSAVTDTFTVEGVANVFEGTVLYSLSDSEGQELDSGFTTGAMGDWGYFDAVLNIPEEIETGEALLLELYTRSAKDGSIEDLIEIQLEIKGDNA